ncbi:MAG: hypothetical protein ACXWMB_00055 [Candidatus Limnocylindria bacterium]
MLDTLTESFCERCGTRYEFEAPEKLTPMRKTRGVITGLKNYIMSQDSLSDSVGDAMRSQAEVLASRQLDAFHSSFSFCIDCRQYTCTNCWNDAAGRCQSCQPLVEGTATWIQPVDGNEQDATAWPASDLTALAPLLLASQPEPVAEPEPEPEPMILEEVPEPEPVMEAAPVVEPVVEPEPEPVVIEALPEPVIEAVPVVEPVVEPEPEIAPQPEPTPIRPLRPIGDTFTHIPRSAPASRDAASVAADSDTLAARKAQLDMLGIGDPGEGPVGPERRVLPYRSSGAASPVAALAGGAFWDASAREVAGAISQVGVRSCAECELSLSATARFCRRCGHPQSQSA